MGDGWPLLPIPSAHLFGAFRKYAALAVCLVSLVAYVYYYHLRSRQPEGFGGSAGRKRVSATGSLDGQDKTGGGRSLELDPAGSPEVQHERLEALLSNLVEYLDRQRRADGGSRSRAPRLLSLLPWRPSADGGWRESGGDRDEAARLHNALLDARETLIALDSERVADLQTALNHARVNSDVRAYILSSYLGGSSGFVRDDRRMSAGATDATLLQPMRGSSTSSDAKSDDVPDGFKLATRSMHTFPASLTEEIELPDEDGLADEISRRSTDTGSGNILSPASDSGAALDPELKYAGKNFSFDTLRLKHSPAPLLKVIPQIVRVMELDSELSPPALKKFYSYVGRIAQGYQNHFYHNELHAADVTCRITAILHHAGLARCPLDVLPAIVSAVIHDYDHPGTSNNFHVATQSDLARRWNNQAVLENHSLEVSLNLMEMEEYNFLADFSPKTVADVRNKIIGIVLATDLSRHFEITEQFRKNVATKAEAMRYATPPNNSRRGFISRRRQDLKSQVMQNDLKLYTSLTTSERLLVLQMAMKVADIGHCFTPLGQHLQWLQRLEDEMFLQGDLESRMELPISCFMDRRKPGVFHPVNQEGFFLAVVEPTVKLWSGAFPSSQPLLSLTQQNLRYWTGNLPE